MLTILIFNNLPTFILQDQADCKNQYYILLTCCCGTQVVRARYSCGLKDKRIGTSSIRAGLSHKKWVEHVTEDQQSKSDSFL